MALSNIISLLGGIALFLFGMGLMGDGLKKVAGSQMEIILYRLSGTPIKGLLLGAGVTAGAQRHPRRADRYKHHGLDHLPFLSRRERRTCLAAVDLDDRGAVCHRGHRGTHDGEEGFDQACE